MKRKRFSNLPAGETSFRQKIGKLLHGLRYDKIAVIFLLVASLLLILKSVQFTWLAGLSCLLKSVQFTWLAGLSCLVFKRLAKVHNEGNNFLKDLRLSFQGFWLPGFILPAGLWIIIYLM